MDASARALPDSLKPRFGKRVSRVTPASLTPTSLSVRLLASFSRWYRCHDELAVMRLNRLSLGHETTVFFVCSVDHMRRLIGRIPGLPSL